MAIDDKILKAMAAIVLDDIASYPMELQEMVEDMGIEFDHFVLTINELVKDGQKQQNG